MTGLLEMVVPALGVSLLALACLALLPRAPSELRFAIASAGLAAWAIPWPLLRWSLPLPAASTWQAVPFAARVGEAMSNVAAATAAIGASGDRALLLVLGAAFGVGIVWLATDCVRALAVVRAWRALGADADSLRELLPAALRTTNVEIRTVRNSAHAAASGYLRPTIWIGDELLHGQTARVALLHECWHVRRRDPLKALLITAIYRAYWWNPLVSALAKHAVLELEAACDRRCALEVGKEIYVAELARTMLAASSRLPLPLAAAAGARGSNLRRLDLLNRETVMRAREHVIVFGFAASVLVVAACQSLEPRPALTGSGEPGGAIMSAAQVSANRFTIDRDSVELVDMHMSTRSAESIVLVHTDRASVQGNAITLAGHVLVAIDGSDLEADELTIRALDGRPLALQTDSTAAIDGREIELSSPRARVTSAYR